MKTAPGSDAEFFESHAGTGPAKLALACLEAGVPLVDHVDAPFAAHDTALAIAALGGLQ